MTEVIEHAARIVAAYVRSHRVETDDVPALIAAVRRTLAGLGTPAEAAHAERTPAVPVRRSVTPDYIICLEDGKPLKTLKRHLRSVYGLTPDEYRKRWHLPDTYPMTAPTYAAERSAAAKARGLGRTRRHAPLTP
ncbi:MucR family transcriptional regulator [Azospirillum thermophilum]|uniref:MucR family transcriptional regulator n=1 Tax=Azospirillum thermophilum TaxID=2202148 RepID=A0A2S2CNK7_9PROT|nr:MucR family transcriptional regulator [Azospirillum thermophilum]AWK85960.1 MucR family transcriptional regulator [Azospirillum thermophilum]